MADRQPSMWGPRSLAADLNAFICQGVKAGMSAGCLGRDLVEQYGYGAHGALRTIALLARRRVKYW